MFRRQQAEESFHEPEMARSPDEKNASLESILQPDAVWCVTLSSMPSKWQSARKRLEKDFPSIQPFEAVDGRSMQWPEAPVDVVTKYRRRNGKKRKYHHEFSTGGAIGCTLSHVALWKRMLEKGHRRIVVLEDDAEVDVGVQKGDLKEAVSKAPWDLFLLGMIPIHAPETVVHSPAVKRVTDVFFGTHAYALTDKGAKFLLARLEFPLTAQVDSWIGMLANLHRDQFFVACCRGKPPVRIRNAGTVSTTQSKVPDCDLCDLEERTNAFRIDAGGRGCSGVVAGLFGVAVGVLLTLLLLFLCARGRERRRAAPSSQSSKPVVHPS